jgi:hypothetical protein
VKRSSQNITEKISFVILCVGAGLSLASCGLVSSRTGEPARAAAYAPPEVVARIKSKELTESSGIAASRCNSDVLWSHNDSGNDETIFAFSTAGAVLGEWKVTGAKNTDWEDIAAYKDASGRCFIYLGDIGDNKIQRPEHNIYRVPEPVMPSAATEGPTDKGRVTAPAEKLTFSYPDENSDAETLMVEPRSGNIYVLTKRISGPSGVYRIRPDFNRPEVQKAELVTRLSVPAIPNGYLTGGDISPDGRRVAICDYTQAYEFSLPDGDQNFDDVWKQEPAVVDLGKRSGGESIAYSVDGSSVYATSEGRNPPLIRVQRR